MGTCYTLKNWHFCQHLNTFPQSSWSTAVLKSTIHFTTDPHWSHVCADVFSRLLSHSRATLLPWMHYLNPAPAGHTENTHQQSHSPTSSTLNGCCFRAPHPEYHWALHWGYLPFESVCGENGITSCHRDPISDLVPTPSCTFKRKIHPKTGFASHFCYIAQLGFYITDKQQWWDQKADLLLIPTWKPWTPKNKKTIWFGLSIQTVLKLSLYQLIFSVIIRKCIPQWLL